MKNLLVISALMISGEALFAQTYGTDPGTMMRQDLSGTARSLGVGGAFSTVGADMSSMSSNPAGIALYRSSEFAFSGGAFGAIPIRSIRDSNHPLILVKVLSLRRGLFLHRINCPTMMISPTAGEVLRSTG